MIVCPDRPDRVLAKYRFHMKLRTNIHSFPNPIIVVLAGVRGCGMAGTITGAGDGAVQGALVGSTAAPVCYQVRRASLHYLRRSLIVVCYDSKPVDLTCFVLSRRSTCSQRTTS